MSKMKRCVLPALMLAVFSGSAAAAAFQLFEQNGSGVGMSYAGSAAVADNASTLFYNPAGLSLLAGGQVSVGIAGIRPSYKYRSNAGQSSGGDAGSWGMVPNAYFSYQLSQDLTAGFGISVPFGLASEYEPGWAGAAQGIKSEIKTINYNPSLAYRVNDKLSLGIGVNYQTIDGELTQTGARLQGDDASWGWNAGALVTLSPSMRLGLSYRSAVKHTLEGTLNGALPVRADLKLPDTAIFSVWQQVSERWEAMGDLSFTRWNSLQKFDVYTAGGTPVSSETFNYQNSWRIAWGAAYKANDALKLKFGLAFDRSPVRNEYRSVRVPDNNRLWLSLGGQWNTGRYGKIDLGYTYVYLRDPSIDKDGLQGKYDASAHVLGAQYSVGF